MSLFIDENYIKWLRKLSTNTQNFSNQTFKKQLDLFSVPQANLHHIQPLPPEGQEA